MAVSSVPSAAHVRTLRKGSSDHLAISIDPESERLANNEQADEDKGFFSFLHCKLLIGYYECPKIWSVC